MQQPENLTGQEPLVNEQSDQQVDQPDANDAQQADLDEAFDPMAELAAAQQQAAQHWDSLLRLQAEMENLRRRSRIEVENAHKYGVEKLLHALVPVADSLELGLEASNKAEASVESIREGLDMTFKQLLDVLADCNVERINPAGEKFDPQKHEAMTMIPSPDHDSNTVVEVFQKGYALNERLIRPARVIVAQ
ncbi:molecular chaperone GrpE [Thiomicrospira aerophila AL3]|uniref:Protein GrpE n=1 Tax=Thiomicrospira aerophila AL3 TaxID=717772 RepID=W0DUM6_9GAMM|nr:nucleotide exchange factor GrpE [Thiomicrospira aerophila]AHF00998.1 molecular chaperone GrpE [Thiomicrospira aerophila AL3]